MSAGAAVRRRAIQPLNPLRTELALVRELFIVHLIIYICTDEYDMGGAVACQRIFVSMSM
jgi:hypothetical protein